MRYFLGGASNVFAIIAALSLFVQHPYVPHGPFIFGCLAIWFELKAQSTALTQDEEKEDK